MQMSTEDAILVLQQIAVICGCIFGLPGVSQQIEGRKRLTAEEKQALARLLAWRDSAGFSAAKTVKAGD
jgi:alkylhydroperoxidase family enzyme